MKVVRSFLCSMSLLGALAFVTAARADIADLFGTWEGTATPTFRFTGNNVQFGSPPYTPYSLQLVIHSFDAVNNDFGTQAAASGSSGGFRVGGDIIALSEGSGSVNLTVFYAQGGDPNGYSDFVGTLSGNLLTGTFNDRSPAPPGVIKEDTNVSLSRVVPEPSSLLLLATSICGLWLRRRRRVNGRS